jgi:hypothetical protein
MGKIGEYLYKEYRPMGSPNEILKFLEPFYSEKFILIEAGAHNGKDSYQFLSSDKISFAFLFEPDSVARDQLISITRPFE